MADFKRLIVWNEAHTLTLDLHARSKRFPAIERYGLAEQIRRSAASIGANVAEGCGRDGDTELKRFIRLARGSAHELEQHLLLARDLHLITGEEWAVFDQRVQRVGRMLTGLLRMPQS